MENKELFELTNPQKSIWLTEQYYNNTTINNISTSATIYEEINEELLKKAIKNVVKQNDSFRIHLIMQDNVVKQYISDYSDFDIETVYISKESEIRKIEKNEAKFQFNIIDSNLFRFKIAILQDKLACIVLTVNHLIADSWSLGLVMQEILKNYNALKSNTEYICDTFSYVDFINAEKNYKSSEKYNLDKNYWKQVFSTLPEQATIPSISKERKNLTFDANRLSFKFNKTLVSKINSFCRENNVSMFNFFMSIFSLYISRVSNIDDFTIGTPIINRANSKEKHTTGMFVNTVPVRVNNLSKLNFIDLVHNFSKNMMSILRHQKYSYNSILEDIRETNKNVPNLYNLIISYQVTKAFDENLGNYKTNWIFNKYCANDFNIHIYDINDTGTLIINYDYLLKKYSDDDVNNFHSHIINIIKQVLNNNLICTDDIEIITNSEKEEIINLFNNTSTDYPKDKTIIDLFKEQVEKNPNKTAIVFEGNHLTYNELDKKSDILSLKLKNENINLEDTVAIFLDKSLEMIVAILAILKAGAAYLPIDVNYPESRINYMLHDSNAKLILTSNNILNLKTTIKTIDISLSNDIYNIDYKYNKINILPNNLAYIMYTSGSTGNPKGVMVEHKNVVRLVKNTNYISFSENDRILQTGSIVFDACTFEIWGALLNGLELYIIKKENLLNPSYLKDFINSNKISILWLTSPLFNKLCEDDLTIFNNVKYLLTGGDVLSPKHINNLLSYNENINIINGYGPTENTTFSCCFKIDKLYNESIPIGKPISNSTCFVVSKTGTFQPIGVPGELYVGGDGVSRGYLNRADLTKAKFINTPNGRIYKTGDLVRWLPNGTIEFLGRIDNQVKIRGFRVELNEINIKISSFPNVKESYTTISTVNGQKHICSYVVFKESATENELRSFLKTALPSYMIPSYIIVLDKLPLNTNGKVDKKALPSPNHFKKSIIKPRNSIDKFIISSLSDLLKFDNISIDDSFIELGIDSLSAITLSSILDKKYNVKISVKDILNDMTISDLSDIIKTANKTSDIHILRSPKQDSYPLSSAQRRIYYSSKMIGENNTVYNIPGYLMFNKKLDTEKVDYVFSEIVQKNACFRTSFIIDHNEIRQKVKKSVPFHVDVYDDDNSDIESIMNNFVKPFNLSSAPLLRVELHNLSNGQSLLLIDSHHIIMDGASLNNLIDDFSNFYNGNTVELNKIDYIDYSLWENNNLESDKIKDDEKYWLNKLSDFSMQKLNLPYDYSVSTKKSFKGEKISITLPPDDFNKLETQAKTFNVSPYVLFLSAFIVLLYKYTNQDEIIIGSPIANREVSETKDLIGMFVNNITIATKIDNNEIFSEFIKRIKTQVLNDIDHQSYPFDLLVKKLNLHNPSSQNPLFDTVFTYQNFDKKNIVINNEEVSLHEIHTHTSKFDITIEIQPNENKIGIEYSTDLFKSETINNLLNHYCFILEQLKDDLNISINDVDIITPVEKETLHKFNNTYEKLNDDTIMTLFEQQVRENPNNVALICDTKYLTYDELNKKANSLAHYLIEKGIKPNDIVGIMANRSFETIVGMLGILKAGAAFLNLDPTYPIERTEYYIKDSNVQYALVQKNLKDKVENIKDCIEIDVDNNFIYNYNSENPHVTVQPKDLSYIIYTSGSTGTPKGVMLNQIGFVNMAKAMTKVLEYLKEGNKHTLLSVTSTPFDIFVYEIFVSLTHGLKVVLANNSEHRNPRLLEKLICQYCVDVMTVTPSLMKIIYDNRESDFALSKVKNMVFGGEPLPERFVKDLKSLSDDITVYNIYGPSEITILSNVQNLNNEKEITVGPPIMNTQIHILDKNMKEVPIGVIGEIYISGIQVGNGYMGKPELTAEKFTNNPFGTGRIYSSGDIGRWTFDGKVQCLGRVDNQIKLRGLRVELGEIENKMLEIDGVSSAIVNKTTINKKEVLCGYYVASKDYPESQIKEILRRDLPPYMIPSYIIKLKEMPYTINRKIDRKALPIPQLNPTIVDSKINIKELDSNEEKLLQIWKNILHVDNIGIDDNFFDLGGDSMSAISMQIESIKYNLEFEYADIFNYPTIRQLAKKVPVPEKKFMQSYNYDKVNTILRRNNMENIETIKKYNFKNVLLIGSTGYLGAHIIDSFMKNEDGIIYCLVRPKNGKSPVERLRNTLNFYYGEKYQNDINNRICVLNGDLTKTNLGLSDDDYEILRNNIDVIINSGAIVKHYGLRQQFEDINVLGTQNIVDICKNENKRLIHISTMSVSGFGEKENNCEIDHIEKNVFHENNLYIGQNIKGIYTSTKYRAEIIVLEAIADGLDAQILRIGNITNRFSDGMFQKNIENNAFANRIKSYIEMGVFPEYTLEHEIELTPVDLCSDAIVKILEYTSSCNVFHLYNPNLLSIKLLCDTLYNNYKIKMIPLSNKQLSYMITGILEDEQNKHIISGIIYDLDNNKNLIYTSKIRLNADFTKNYLSHIGFEWKSLDENYIKKYLEYFNKINFLNLK